MSPAEAQFVRLMGGRVLTIKHIKLLANNFPLTIIVSVGKTLRREYVQREYRIGAFYADFAFVTSDGKKLIEIDGAKYHRDIVKELERDEYLAERGWQVMHITATDVYRNPESVRKLVIDFLAR